MGQIYTVKMISLPVLTIFFLGFLFLQTFRGVVHSKKFSYTPENLRQKSEKNPKSTKKRKDPEKFTKKSK